MFDHKKVYHSAFAKSEEPVRIRVTSDVTKSQFKDQGADYFYIDFEYDGHPHQLKIENEAIKRQLAGLKGHNVEIRASGKGDDATIEVRDLGSDGRTSSPPAQRPAANSQPRPSAPKPPAHDAIKKARAQLTRSANGYILAARAARFVANTMEAEGTTVDDEHMRTLTATLFIRLDRSGLLDDLPLKLDEAAPPKAAEPPPPPPKEPEPPADPDLDAPEDDIPF